MVTSASKGARVAASIVVARSHRGRTRARRHGLRSRAHHSLTEPTRGKVSARGGADIGRDGSVSAETELGPPPHDLRRSCRTAPRAPADSRADAARGVL